jgi:hypothetical protein
MDDIVVARIPIAIVTHRAFDLGSEIADRGAGALDVTVDRLTF